MATTDMDRLAGFQKHFEDMRALIHCKVCLKPFYEPYTLPCGHTYCYSCLSSWCTGSHNRGKTKTCPDCRAPISSQPSPNFLLRDLVQMFLTHTELLPEDETIEEHRKGKEDESRIVTADRAGPGLFKGLFQKKRFAFPGFHARSAIADAEDGVQRCPQCAWELEDGECNHCDWSPDMDDSDSYDSDLDERDFSPVDDINDDPFNLGSPGPHAFGAQSGMLASETSDDEGAYMRPPGYEYTIHDIDSEGDMETDEDDEDMSSFISNDEDQDLPNEHDDDDDESVHTIHGYRVNSPARQYSTDGAEQSPPPRHFHGIDIEVGDSSDDDNDSEDGHTNMTVTTQTSSDGSDAGDDASEQHTNYDSDDSSVREIPPPIISQTSNSNRSRGRRVIDDDDDDEDEDEDSGESDDTATRPPQASTARFSHLRGRQQRRASNFHLPQMTDRRRVSPSPEEEEEPPRQSGRRLGSNYRSTGASSMPVNARRGRPATTRVY